jgi:hypothetical protein
MSIYNRIKSGSVKLNSHMRLSSLKESLMNKQHFCNYELMYKLNGEVLKPYMKKKGISIKLNVSFDFVLLLLT